MKLGETGWREMGGGYTFPRSGEARDHKKARPRSDCTYTKTTALTISSHFSVLRVHTFVCQNVYHGIDLQGYSKVHSGEGCVQATDATINSRPAATRFPPPSASTKEPKRASWATLVVRA